MIINIDKSKGLLYHVHVLKNWNGLFQKKIRTPPPPRRMGSFFNPLSPGFPEAQDPPPFLSGFSRQKTPLLPEFPWKIIRLIFNLFLIENMRNHIQKMFFFNL